MEKIKKILHSTITKVISTVLIISFCISIYFCHDFYRDVCVGTVERAKGYWWVYQGDKALKKQDLQGAVECYTIGIRHYPKHYRALYNLANIYVFYEDYYAALINYERALMIKPDFDLARIDYAIILSQVYMNDEAIDQYKKVLNQKRRFIKIPLLVDSKKAHKHNRGVAYYNMGGAYKVKSMIAGNTPQDTKELLQEAAKSYEKAAEILKTYNANYNLALIHQLLKNYNQSAKYYCKAIELEPMKYEAHFNYAVLLSEKKDYIPSEAEFKKAGLLLDLEGDFEKKKFVYDVLADVNKKIALNKDSDYYKRINESNVDEAKYKAGKLVIELEAKKNKKADEFIKSFSVCEPMTNAAQ